MDAFPLQATVSRQGGQVVAHLVTLHTETLAVLAVAVPGTVRHLHTTSALLARAQCSHHLALLVSHAALLPLPAGLADALAARVVALAAAQDRAHACTAARVNPVDGHCCNSL